MEIMTSMHDFANGQIPTCMSFNGIYKMHCNMHGVYETRQAHLLHIPSTKPLML